MSEQASEREGERGKQQVSDKERLILSSYLFIPPLKNMRENNKKQSEQEKEMSEKKERKENVRERR